MLMSAAAAANSAVVATTPTVIDPRRLDKRSSSTSSEAVSTSKRQVQDKLCFQYKTHPQPLEDRKHVCLCNLSIHVNARF